MDTAFLQPSKNVEDRRNGLPSLNRLGALLAEIYWDGPRRDFGLGQSYAATAPVGNMPFAGSIDKFEKRAFLPWAWDYPAQYNHAKALHSNIPRGVDDFGEWVGKPNKDRTRPWAMMAPPVEQTGAFQW